MGRPKNQAGERGKTPVRAPEFLKAYRDVAVQTSEGQAKDELQKTVWRVKKDNPEGFLDRLQKAELEFSKISVGGGRGARPTTEDEGSAAGAEVGAGIPGFYPCECPSCGLLIDPAEPPLLADGGSSQTLDLIVRLLQARPWRGDGKQAPQTEGQERAAGDGGRGVVGRGAGAGVGGADGATNNAHFGPVNADLGIAGGHLELVDQ